MNFFRIALVLALAVVGVLAQVSYLTRLADVLNKIQAAIDAVPGLKPCVAGMPMDVPSWVAMDADERKSALMEMADQTKFTLQKLNRDPSIDKQIIVSFDEITSELVDIVVDGTIANELTAAPAPVPTTTAPAPVPTTTAPVPTTTAPEPTTTAPEPTTAAPEPTTTAPAPTPSPTNTTTDAPPTTAPVTTMPPPSDACDVLANQDRLGFDLTNVRGAVGDCFKKCQATKGCATYTWSGYNGGTCWLKSRAGKLIEKAGVSATSCVATETPALVCNELKDVDFVGMDIANKAGANAGECCDLCSETTGCSAYSWTNFNGGTCWLKKSVGHVVARVGVTSSSIVQLWGPVCPFEYDTDFEGNDIGNKPAADAGKCCDLCKATSACKAYSWSNYNSGTCWMKSGKGKTTFAKGVISAKLVGF